jgi:glycosyltransferase involved in cell wall biosynthesis
MKIAYVCCDPGIPVFGCKGSSVHVQEVLREFVRRGHQLDLYATRIGGVVPPALADVRVHSIALPGNGKLTAREQALHDANRVLAAMLTSEGPYDLVYERHSLYASAAMQYAHQTRTPAILEVNSPLMKEQAAYRTLENQSLATRHTRQAFVKAGAVVAVSEPVADYVRRYRNQAAQIHVIPNAVDVERFDPSSRASRHPGAGDFTIGFVGTLKPWHGVTDLVRAFSLLADHHLPLRLLIVGDGPQIEALRQQAHELSGVANRQAHFTGAVPPAEVPRLLAEMDVAVAPYPELENCYFSPLKIFEYMAAGLPTVASRTGQIPMLLGHGETGLLVPPGNPTQLAGALRRLIQDPALRMRLGRAARALVERQFTWSVVVDRLEQIAAQLPARRSRPPRPHFSVPQSPCSKPSPR